MSDWKSSNDGYCCRCGVNTRLFQPKDFCTEGRGSKSSSWYCLSCLRNKFGIEKTDENKFGESVEHCYNLN